MNMVEIKIAHQIEVKLKTILKVFNKKNAR